MDFSLDFKVNFLKMRLRGNEEGDFNCQRYRIGEMCSSGLLCLYLLYIPSWIHISVIFSVTTYRETKECFLYKVLNLICMCIWGYILTIYSGYMRDVVRITEGEQLWFEIDACLCTHTHTHSYVIAVSGKQPSYHFQLVWVLIWN